jgi:hypothetical protein
MNENATWVLVAANVAAYVALFVYVWRTRRVATNFSNERPWWIPAVDMRAIVVLLIFVFFGVAYANNPSDETLKGALIAAFSGAWGFYLGSSRSAGEIRQQADTATKTARDAVAFARETAHSNEEREPEEPTKVEVVQPPGKPVPTKDVPGGAAAPPSDPTATPAMEE